MTVTAFVKKRPCAFFGAGTTETAAVNIENAATHEAVKIVVEDIGIMAFQPEKKRVVIEGLAYRYIFCGSDILWQKI